MDKTVKNIVLIVLLVLLFVASYFTVNHIRNNNVVNFDNTKFSENSNNPPSYMPKFDNKEDNVIDNNDNTETTDKSNTTDRSKRSNNRPSRDKGNFNRDDFNKNFDFNNIKKPNNKNVDIFYILFGLESACAGAIILYLILSNFKKEETKKK